NSASRGTDPAAATISRLLHASPRVRFEERHLPRGLASVKRLVELPVKRRAALARKIAPPKGFAAVRVESDSAGRVAAIGVSQDYDPIGEISPGAYWIVLSSDGGKTWGRPLYTGLRVNQPYVVRELSALPLFDG